MKVSELSKEAEDVVLTKKKEKVIKALQKMQENIKMAEKALADLKKDYEEFCQKEVDDVDDLLW
jgi:flagellar hook-associated protein FlgK